MTVLTLQPDAATGQDNAIRKQNATTNYGAANVLIFGSFAADGSSAWRSLLKFDLSSIPAGSTINSAVLTVVLVQKDGPGTNKTMSIYRLKRPWVESESTWNIYSTGNNWQAAGGFGADDCDYTVIGTSVFNQTDTLNVARDIVLTATTKEELDLGNGWMLRMPEVQDDYRIASSDHATAAWRPKLVIEYTLPAVGAVSISPAIGSLMPRGGVRITPVGR